MSAVSSALFHFIDGDHDQQPAVPGYQLKQWLGQGFVNLETYVWADDGSMSDWTTLREAGLLYEYCTEESDPTEAGPPDAKHDAKHPTVTGQAVSQTVTGQAVLTPRETAPVKPPVFFIHDSDIEAERKYEKKRKLAKWLATASALLLACTAAATLWWGSGLLEDHRDQRCGVSDTPLLHVVYAWLLVFSLLLLGAELGATCLRTYVNFLSYRTGRAGLGFFCSSVVFASALCVEESPTTAASHFGRPQWRPLLVAAALLAASATNLSVTKFGKKIRRSRSKQIGDQSKLAALL